MYILILEDDPDRIKWFRKRFEGHRIRIHDNVEMAIKEAVQMFSWKNLNLILLDHDLGDFAKGGDGIQFAKWLVEFKANSGEAIGVNPKIIVHSHNPVGADRMASILEDSFDVYQIPFSTLQKLQTSLEEFER